MEVYWPDIIKVPVEDISKMDKNNLLAQQLICWGNIYMGYEPPDNFYDAIDAASKITGVFTS